MEAMKEKMRGAEVPEDPVGTETAEEAISRIFGVEPQPAAARPKSSARPAERERAPVEAKTELAAEAKQEQPKADAFARRSIMPAADLVAAIVQRIRGRIAKRAEKVPDLAVDVHASVEDVINLARVPVELPDGELL